jgi:hypothetical protein
MRLSLVAEAAVGARTLASVFKAAAGALVKLDHYQALLFLKEFL